MKRINSITGTKFLFFLITLFFQVHLLIGQMNNTFFTNYTLKDGLSDNIIHCIFQDSRGWIWVGTSFGVLRFDGYEFKKLDLNDEFSSVLGKSLIRCIYEDNKGVIWIAAENQGVFLYNHSVYNLKQIKGRGGKNELCNNSVWSILQDKNGTMWLGTEAGLVNYDKTNHHFTSFFSEKNIPSALTNDFIRSLLLDHEGNLWIGTGNGVSVKQTNSTAFLNYSLGEKLNEHDNEVYRIFEDKNNQIWIGTYVNGLKKFNKTLNKFIDFNLGESNERTLTVRAITQDADNNIWVGSRGGLICIEPTRQKILKYIHNDQDDNSVLHNSIMTLLLDKKGDLWIGSRGGISYLNFDKQSFKNISAGSNPLYSLKNSEIYAFWEDVNNQLWIGTESGGISIYNKETGIIKHITNEQGLSNNCIKALCYDGNGNLLAGTYLGGLNQINLSTLKVKQFMHRPGNIESIADDAVWTIYKDRKANIWIGTSTGIDQFDPVTGKFTHFGKTFNVTMVEMIFEDSRRNLWIYSENNKLTRVDSLGNIRDYPYKARSMCEDHFGNLWLGTIGNGLVKLNIESGKVNQYTTSDGLSNNVLYGVQELSDKYIWISTLNGISRFEPATGLFRNYYQNDGLLNNQFNYGASFLGKDNVLYYGGNKGVDIVHTLQIKENNYIPNVVFTDFKIFNKSVVIDPEPDNKSILSNFISETQSIVIQHNQNMITFEFAALNYANSSKNQYAYKLEGFDKDWNHIGNQRKATYTNLDHGQYILKVIGSNNDNKFNLKGAEIQLTVLPPFWKTFWFRLIILLVLILLITLIYFTISAREKLRNQLIFERESKRKVNELDLMKHQFFMNISHEIRTPLSMIMGPLDKLLTADMDEDGRKKHLEIIRRNSINLNKLVSQLLDYRKLETGNVKLELKKGNITLLVNDIVDSFKELAAERSVELIFKTIQKEIITFFDTDKIEKILNNLLSNALKYTNEGGKVNVNLSLVFSEEMDRSVRNKNDTGSFDNNFEQFIQIVVRDTGIGIPASQVSRIFNRFIQVKNQSNSKLIGTGIGLSLTKDLVKLHQGAIQVQSIEGKGSKFTLLIPMFTESNENDQPELISTENILNPNNEKNEISNTAIQPNSRLLLIIDDNADIREFIKFHFIPEYQVIEAKNGSEGWNKSLEEIPDIIIADVMMPIMDGKELCRKIKRDERTSHIPVIMLTALSSKENQISGIDVGADDYITKPFDVSLLKAKVDNLLSIRKVLRDRFSKEMFLRPKEIILSSPDEKFLTKIIAYIEKNMDNAELDVDKIAQNLAVSRTQLYRKLAALTDMSAKEFVRDMRLKRAAQLITQDKLTFNEIALLTGFNDISYFRKCFREKFGMNASEYLKNNVSQNDDIIM